MHITITTGTGDGPTPRAAVDTALLSAGVANSNLVYLASVIPAGSFIQRARYVTPYDEYGHQLYVVMARQEAYDVETAKAAEHARDRNEPQTPVHYTYRHGDGSATIINTELCDSPGRRVQIVETGTPLTANVTVRFERQVDEPVIGFLIRNRVGIHAYGTNTQEQQIRFGAIRSGEVVTVQFAFRCWLGIDDYSISFAVHSLEGQAYDWLDGALFFRVVSATLTEGVANLNATATVLTRQPTENRLETESVGYG